MPHDVRTGSTIWSRRSSVRADRRPPVLPAISHLVALGIADPERLGGFGQSRGYSVFALLTQTERFKAGVALARSTSPELDGFVPSTG